MLLYVCRAGVEQDSSWECVCVCVCACLCVSLIKSQIIFLRINAQLDVKNIHALY